jgi:hypothetical protein
MYEKVKSIKPHACVNKSGLTDPYMQPFADVALISEDWNGSSSAWYLRSRISMRLLSDLAFITAPYFLTITKSYEYFMGMAVWNILQDPIVKHAIHPYQHFRELSEKDFRRRFAGVRVKSIAPINITDKIHVDLNDKSPGGVEMWRKRTYGPLKDWYASLAFGKRCFAAYSEREVRIAASETRRIDSPLPPGAKIESVTMVPHEGKAKAWPYDNVETADGPGIRLRITDCGREACYFSIAYEIRE